MQLNELYHKLVADATTFGYNAVMSVNPDPHHLQAWRLFITTHARLIRRIDADLAAANQIPLGWYDVLIELYEAPEHKLRMHDLAERVVLSRSGLTRLVDRLEKEELLVREIDSEDRRGFYAILTAKGMAALRAAWPIYANGIRAYFAQHLSIEESDLLVNAFTRMTAT